MEGWQKNGFKTSKGTNVKNRDDIIKLYTLCQKINVKWVRIDLLQPSISFNDTEFYQSCELL